MEYLVKIYQIENFWNSFKLEYKNNPNYEMWEYLKRSNIMHLYHFKIEKNLLPRVAELF